MWFMSSELKSWTLMGTGLCCLQTQQWRDNHLGGCECVHIHVSVIRSSGKEQSEYF